MPARPPVPDVLKVEFLWNQDGLPAANVKYVLFHGTAPTPAACAAIAEALGTAFWNVASPLYPEATILEAVRVTDLTTDTGSEGTWAGAAPGTGSGFMLPAGCCVLMDHTIGRRYRGGHPRTYYPACSDTEYIAPASWSSTVISTMTSAEAAYALEASTFSESGCEGTYNVNVSYVTAGAPRVAPVIDQITGSVCSAIVRSQRRRLTASSY